MPERKQYGISESDRVAEREGCSGLIGRSVRKLFSVNRYLLTETFQKGFIILKKMSVNSTSKVVIS